MTNSFRYRNEFLCQNEPILNFPQGQGVLDQGGQAEQGQGGPDPDPVQPQEDPDQGQEILGQGVQGEQVRVALP